MTVSKKYNDNLVAGGAVRDGNGNRINTTYAKIANLASVATSGSYNDLTNKPVTDLNYDGTSANAQSGVAVEQAINTVKRNIGEVVTSTIPLTDAGLHLLDGSLISGSGVYAEFVKYIANIYDNNSVDTVFKTPTLTENGVMGGNSFAVSMSDGNTNAWKFFNSSNANPALTNAIEYIQIYSPNPLKITSFFAGLGVWIVSSGSTPSTFYTASNDGINWDSISSLSENINYYSYYRMNFSWEQESIATLSSDFSLNATYKTSSNCFCIESDWQNSVTTYGVCGKFVYDSVNNTVRLPKITGFTEGTTDVNTLGNLTEAGLPNIEGSIYIKTSSGGTASGAFTFSSENTGVTPSGTNKDKNVWANLNASRSSSIYGNSDTVQPQSVKVLYYIVVANKTKTDIEVDIDNIATELNTCLDTKRYDGQWVLNEITANTSTDLGTYTIDLSTYLPNDGYTYEIICNAYINRATTSTSGGTNTVYNIKDNLQTITWSQIEADYSNFQQATDSFIVIVGSERALKLIISGLKCDGAWTKFMAYRRIGTNS